MKKTPKIKKTAGRSISSLAEIFHVDRRTLSRAIREADPELIPCGQGPSGPLYDEVHAKDALLDYQAARLPPWNPSPEECRQRLADLSMKLLYIMEHMACHGGSFEEALKAGVKRHENDEKLLRG